jgi:hypothetical protein
MVDDRPRGERPDIEVLFETIDRNSDRDWADYREVFEFVVVGESEVRVVSPGEDREVDHVVGLEGGRAAACDCFSARRPDGSTCRHVRAVDAHPLL